MAKFIPQNGSLVSASHCVRASSPVWRLENVVTSIWRKTWESTENRAVISKTYKLTANTITELKLITFPIDMQKSQTEKIPPPKGTETTESETEESTSSLSILEMLITIAKNELIQIDGVTYTLQNKEFRKKGTGWECALKGKDANGNETELRRDELDFDHMVYAARSGDIIADTQSLITKKTFKEVKTNEYQVSIDASGTTYTATRNSDFNGVFLIAARGDHVNINNVTYTISYKLCDVVRSNQNYVYASLYIY